MIRQIPESRWFCSINNWFGEVPDATLPYLIRGSGAVGNGSFLCLYENEIHGPYAEESDAKTMAIYESKDGGQAVVVRCLVQGDRVKGYKSLYSIEHVGELESLMDRIMNGERYLIETGALEKAEIDPNQPEGLETYVIRLLNDWDGDLDDVDSEYEEEYTGFVKSKDWTSMDADEVRESFVGLGMWVPPSTRDAITNMVVHGFNRSVEIAQDVKQVTGDELSIDTSLNLQDTNTLGVLNRNAGALMPASFKKQGASQAMKMYAIMVSGFEKGLTLGDIVGDITEQIPTIVDKRQKLWTKVAAHSVIGRARAYAQLGSYMSAGITEIVYSAILDEVTTPTCVFMDGKTIGVEQAYNYHKEKIENEENMEEAFPWVQVQARKGESVNLYVNRGGIRTPVASAPPGGAMKWANGMDMNNAVGMGIFPPAHARCRSTTVVRLS